jgi:hypothetical protein
LPLSTNVPPSRSMFACTNVPASTGNAVPV